ncbi:MAG: CAP domain-containing protein, partial [Clostridium sp.]|nr:CAP domain-containing protein [Clostridium sp.]
NTATWNANYVGSKILYVDVKDSSGKVITKTMNYVIKEKPIVLGIDSFTTSKVSPQVVGTEVTLTAKGTGNGTLQYRFRVGDGSGNYSIIKNYSTSNIATWNANYIGSKILYVDVKDSKGNIVTKSVNYIIKAKPLEINSFTTDKVSPQYKGSSIKVTANASGGEGTLQYRFRVGNPAGSYSLVKDYSTTNTAVWNANYSGSKILYVDVKDSKGNVVTKSINYSIKEKPIINSFTTDKNSPQNLGTTIKLTANVSEGENLQYKFSLKDEYGNTTTLRDYSYSNTCNWTPSRDGDYTLYVDTKDSLGITLRKSINYNIIFACKVNTDDFGKIVGSEMYRLVNEHRNNNGVASFTVDSVMEECAYEKSKHMSDNNYFDHEYNGKLWWDMYPEKYANWSNLGENIVLSHIDPNKMYTIEECKKIAEKLFTLWKNSPGHNANMLNSSFKQIGFGLYVNSSGSVYGTQEFITRFK